MSIQTAGTGSITLPPDEIHTTRAPSQYPKRRLFVISREVSKPRDWYFKSSYRFEIWQALRQQCCRSACQISERSDNSKYKSRGFETLRDLTKRRLFVYWDGALSSHGFTLVHEMIPCRQASNRFIIRWYIGPMTEWSNEHLMNCTFEKKKTPCMSYVYGKWIHQA